jgi:hypothetical protein
VIKGLCRNQIPLLAVPFLWTIVSVARADVYETTFFEAQLTATTGSLSSIGLDDTISGNFIYDVNLLPPSQSGFQSVPFSVLPLTYIPDNVAFQIALGPDLYSLGDMLPGAAIQYDNGMFDGFDIQFDFVSQGNEYEFIEQGNSFEIELLEGNQPTGDIVVKGTMDIIGPGTASDGGGNNPGGDGNSQGTGGSSNDLLSYALLTNPVVAGTDNFGPNSLFDQQVYSINPSNTVSLQTPPPVPVPEPSMFWSLLVELCGLVVWVEFGKREAGRARISAQAPTRW